MRPARLARLAARLVAPLLVGTLVQVAPAPAQAAVPVPPTPTGLPSGIETLQTYVGQALCDPVAKPGVAAFRSLLLSTYAGTTDLGIVRDCGVGGQSEHKEGRAWDWGVSVSNATQKAQADTLLAWLLKTDAQGHTFAMARRFGVMYVIWDKRIWKAWQATQGWQAYSGTDPHTGHVHFSFGWSGAKKATSYWSKAVAAFDPGPAAPVTPVRSPANLALLRTYGGTTLTTTSTGTPVATLQRALRLVVDGRYGTQTVDAVKRFQQQQGLTVTGTFGPTEWRTLFPPPVVPFGAVDAATTVPGGTVLSGWALDADTSAPLTVKVLVDGTEVTSTTASVDRPDMAAAYPGFGTGHGFAVTRTLAEGTHTVCATGVNAPGTAGSDGALGCRTVVVTHLPSGTTETASPVLGKAHVTGWAVDPDTTTPVTVAVSVDGGTPTRVTADAARTDLPAAWSAWGTRHGLVADVPAAEGEHQVCLTAVNLGMGADRPLGCRTVVVHHGADGALTTVGLRPGGVLAAGWGLDPDVTAPVPVTVTVDGGSPSQVTADAGADAAGATLPASYAPNGTAHGFTTLLPLPEGPHTVCATVANAAGTPGTPAPAACRTLTALHSPQGRVDRLATAPGGGVAVRAWALDPDVAGSTAVQVRVDGGTPRTFTANTSRPDVAAAWPGFGAAHGLQTTVPVATGWHQVCVSAVNASGTAGSSVLLGCRSLLLGSPSGALDPARVSTGKAVLSGWVLDPDVARAAGWRLAVDGTVVAHGSASTTRRGFGLAHPAYGDAHGFRLGVPLSHGKHRLCLTALNVTGTRGGNRSLGCIAVAVP